MKPKDIAKILLRDNLVMENRQGGMYHWIGWTIPCRWELREDVKKTLELGLEKIANEKE